MNVMHLLASLDTGGIESLCRDYDRYSNNNNIFVVFWGKNGANANAMRKNGGVVIELDSDKKAVIKVYRTLCRLVRQYSIDVIVAHHASPITHIYMQLLKGRYHHLKTVAYAHGAAEDMFRHNDTKGAAFRKRALGWSLKKSSQIIAISNDVKKSLTTCFNVPKDRIAVVYNGTDTSRFTPKAHRVFHSPLRLIYVGRLIREKGVQSTITALSALSPKLSWSFDIAGDGSYRSQLEKQVESLGLQKRIHFLGNCENIPELLGEHDVFIHMPEWDEGFGITIIEAMAAGLLCICRRRGGIPEIISDGKDGILVSSNEELTAVLSDVLSESNDRRFDKICANALVRAGDFDIKRFAEQLDCVICGLE